jgi:AcrR family transcriptional regulator
MNHKVQKYRWTLVVKPITVLSGMKRTRSGGLLGRPRAFDIDQALERALRVFWEKGYEGSSLSDLTQAMGINRPSLYAAFGNKEALFRKALDRYVEMTMVFVRDAINEQTARGVAERLLRSAADMVTNPHDPPGCLTVRGALSSGEEADPVRLELALRRSEGEALIRKRLERAKRDGELPSRANPADLARYLATVYQGMSVQAAGGATREQLRRVAETALRAWPK